MTPGVSATSEASAVTGLAARCEQAERERDTLVDLWRMTGFDIPQRPGRWVFARALWLRAELDDSEGRAPRLPHESSLWYYLDAADTGCGVDVFL